MSQLVLQYARGARDIEAREYRVVDAEDGVQCPADLRSSNFQDTAILEKRCKVLPPPYVHGGVLLTRTRGLAAECPAVLPSFLRYHVHKLLAAPSCLKVCLDHKSHSGVRARKAVLTGAHDSARASLDRFIIAIAANLNAMFAE